MSRVELLEAQGSAWSYLLVAVLFFAVPLALAWLSVHQGALLLEIYRRGRTYRRRLRNARHAARPHRLVRSAR